MNGTTVLDWLPRTLLGGGVLLLLAWLWMSRLASPVRQQRLGEWALASALLVAILSIAPAWMIFTLPGAASSPESGSPSTTVEGKPIADIRTETILPALEDKPDPEIAPWVFVAAPPAEEGVEPEPLPQLRPQSMPREEKQSVAAETSAPSNEEPIAPRLLVVSLALYFVGATLFLGRWLLGHLVLWRLLRRTEIVPSAMAELFASMTVGCHRARLLLSARARVPFSFGLLRPTVVLPAAIGRNASPPVLRWIFAHELTHLRRRDAWSSVLFGLAQVLYFPLPWFWRLRYQVRLCQEFIADAAAAHLGCPEDYAQFLLSWTTAPAAPAGVTGVSGPHSDLFRRITMLLQSPAPVEPRCPRRWSLLAAVGLLSLAVLVAGVDFAVQAAPVPVKKDEPKKEEPKKDEPKKDEAKKTEPKKSADLVDELVKQLPPGTDPAMVKQMREHMERALRDLTPDQAEQMRQQMTRMVQMMAQRPLGIALPPGGFPGQGFPGAPGMMGPGMPGPRLDSRLGARIESPGKTLAEQLDLPKGQGLVLREVPADSAAAKAGLKPHDILLELNGKPVSDRVEALAKIMADIKPDTAVEAVVLRKGKKETIEKLSLPEAKAVQPGFGFQQLPGGFPDQPNVIQPPGGLPPAPAFQGVPGGIGFMPPGGGGRTVMTTMFRTDDRLTLRHQEGSLVITLTGKVADGKAKVSDIHVQDGRETNKYESVDKVPEQYRDKVKNLVEMSEKSTVRIEIK